MTRRLVVAAAVVCLVAGCSSGKAKPTPTLAPTLSSTEPSPSAIETPTPTPTPSAVPTLSSTPSAAASTVCRSSQLRLSIGSTEGGAGQVHQDLVLTNHGAACSLHGYPGVSFLDAAGQQVGDAAAMNPGKVSRVQLAAGGHAVAVLSYSNSGAYPAARCRPKQASTVRVYPPGERVALTAPDSVVVCSATGIAQLHVDPVT
jgi:hypothetical protein